jgi:hypothetical protein
MSFKTTNKQLVEEVPYGMYVWECPDGEILGDGDGNIMNVFCMKGDRKAIQALRDAARHYGFPEGRPVWWSGKRRVTDEEYEEQEARERLGLVADPLDYGAIKDAERARKAHGG